MNSASSKQIAKLFVLLGWGKLLRDTAGSDDPQVRVLRWADDGSELDQWYEANESSVEKKLLIQMTVAVMEEQIGQHPEFCFTFRGKPIRWELTRPATS